MGTRQTGHSKIIWTSVIESDVTPKRSGINDAWPDSMRGADPGTAADLEAVASRLAALEPILPLSLERSQKGTFAAAFRDAHTR